MDTTEQRKTITLTGLVVGRIQERADANRRSFVQEVACLAEEALGIRENGHINPSFGRPVADVCDPSEEESQQQ